MFNDYTKYQGVNAFLIARVSDISQLRALPGQKKRLLEYAEKLGLDAQYYEFNETAFKTDERHKFAEIVNEIKQCDKFSVVVFVRIDRLTRDTTSSIVAELKQLVKKGKIELHFPSECLILHKDSPAADWTRLNLGAVTSEYYALSIGDSVKQRFGEKIDRGELPGRVPIGYKNVTIGRTERDKKITDVIVDEERAPYIKRAFELRVAGKSFKTIAKTLRKEGFTTLKGQPVAQSMIYLILKNEFYIGTMMHKGVKYPHKYPTLIDKQTFYIVQGINQIKTHHKEQSERRNSRDIPTYSGVLRCGKCGGAMSTYIKKGHSYLRCSKRKYECGNCNVSEALVDNQIADVFSRLSIPEETIKAAHILLTEKYQEKETYLTHNKATLQRRAQDLRKQLEIAYEDRLNGSITMNQYSEIAKRKEAQIAKIEDTLEDLEASDNSPIMDVAYLLDLAKRAPEIFKSSRTEQKNQILKIIFSNLKIQQKNIDFTLLEPFNVLFNYNKCSAWLPGLDSNQ